jgi:cell division septum initiation protein DivIVA
MGVITVPKALRDKLGNDGADAFVEVIKEIDLDARKDALALAEERFERRLTEEFGKLKLEIEKLRTEMKVEMEKMRVETKTEMEKIRAETKTEMEKIRAETKTEMEKIRAETKAEMEKMGAETSKEIEKTRAETNIDMGKMRAETKTEMEKLKTEIERSKGDIIKWTFIFWIGQIGAFSAILFAMLKIYFR